MDISLVALNFIAFILLIRDWVTNKANRLVISQGNPGQVFVVFGGRWRE